MEEKKTNYDIFVKYVIHDEDKNFKYSDSLYDMFYTNDYPIPYKGLKFYPLTVDLYNIFFYFSECLLVPHKTIGDIKGISLPYLDYLYYLASEKNEGKHLYFLGELLKLSLHLDDNAKIEIYKKDNRCVLIIENKSFDAKDFDQMRKIIANQNNLELLDEETSPAIIQAWEKLEEYNIKKNNIKVCGLEDQINLVVIKTSYIREQILKMTIRSFFHILSRIDKVMQYELQTLLSPDMNKEQIKNIPYYLEANKTQKDKYKMALIDR